LSRRRLLAAAAGGAALAATPAYLRGGRLLTASAKAAAPRPFQPRLPIPRVIDSSHIKLPIVEAEIPILPGPKTRMWTYGGDFPGPTVRRPTGETTRATFTHRLPKEAGELTTHLHGGHNTSADDGQPGGLTKSLPRSYCDISSFLTPKESGNDLLIEPGRSRTYTYEFIEGGDRERGATHWYHDHRLDNTARNVWRGLSGFWISEDDAEDDFRFPRGAREIPLLISDRSFTSDNQLTNPFGGLAHAPDDGVTGRYVLVNGAVLPHHRVRACRHRLRILNASSFRSYNLRIGGGATIVQIGTESGLMPSPIPRRTLLVGPGERLDVIVDFRNAKHSNVILRSVARQDGPNRLGSKPYVGPLMQFRVGKPLIDRTTVPALLRPLPGWVDSAPASPQKEWKITIGGGIASKWLINDRTYDPAFVEHRAELGTVETWKLINATAVAHLFHLHHTDWYLISRNGKPPAPWEACMKETFFMDPGDELLIAGRFSDYAGKYVVHCHMLDHEDHGLMSQFETFAA
jgi:FtsP/CotA-like multicopper oxidase with cupredoxin domain